MSPAKSIPGAKTALHGSLSVEKRFLYAIICACFLLLATPAVLAQDLCTISNFSGTVGTQEATPADGDIVAVFFNPDRCAFCSYPHRIESVTFSLAGDGSQWPVTVDVVVYDRHPLVGHPCAGPGAELYRQSVICDQATFEYPNAGTIAISMTECLTGPVYVALDFDAGNAQPMPRLVFDDTQAPESCLLWYYSAADSQWREWRRQFADALPGHPWIDLTITEKDSECDTPCFMYGDADGSGSWSIGDGVLMQNWWYSGGAVPAPGADVNGDGLIDRDDWLGILSFIICIPEDCFPPGYKCGPSEPFGYRCLVDAGDADGDRQYSISDAVYIVNYIFGGGSAPTPLPVAAGDANGDCALSIADAVYLINYIFGGGEAPAGCSDWLSNCGSLY